jgi:hypothetical protein
MVASEENIILYRIEETSQGRKILSCTGQTSQAKAGKYSLVSDQQDQSRLEIFSCTRPMRPAEAGKYYLIPGPRDQPRQEIILLNRTIETSLGKKLQYSLVPDRRD